jgi:hypothetical protein
MKEVKQVKKTRKTKYIVGRRQQYRNINKAVDALLKECLDKSRDSESSEEISKNLSVSKSNITRSQASYLGNNRVEAEVVNDVPNNCIPQIEITEIFIESNHLIIDQTTTDTNSETDNN